MTERVDKEQAHISKIRDAYAQKNEDVLLRLRAETNLDGEVRMQSQRNGNRTDFYIGTVHVKSVEIMKSSMWRYDICEYTYSNHVN